MGTRVATIAIGVLIAAGGCRGPSNWRLRERTGGSAALFAQFQAYDGRSGSPMSFSDVAAICARADIVLFGEEHNNAVCNQLEAQLLAALAERGPAALAMEFFEADTQAAADAYLEGRIDEDQFREQTRQKSSYILSHRPLIELCRAGHLPMIAANVPRRLVRAYSASGLNYDDFRLDADPNDQRWLPRESVYLTGEYRDRFMGMMAAHPAATPQPTSRPAESSRPATAPASIPATTTRTSEDRGERFYRSQLLWDNAMAESVSDFRGRYPRHTVMLVVGKFHVSLRGGTWTRLRELRPNDRIRTVVFRGRNSRPDEFEQRDLELGDVVIYGITPPPPRPATTTTRPASQSTSQPASSGPLSRGS